MPVKIALGGDVNFSRHRGELHHLVRKAPAPLVGKVINRIKARSGLGREVGFDPVRVIEEIQLEGYGRVYRNPHPEPFDTGVSQTPFRGIGSFFRDADVGFVNLETPLSDHGRHVGAFASPTGFAGLLVENGIGVVSLANNHAFDAGERGFLETLRVLQENGMAFTGGGHDLAEARRGCVLQVGGLKLGFLGYTSFCNSHFMSLATTDQAGILPLLEPLFLEDIENMRGRCDFLTVAPHFDFENRTVIHPNTVRIARRMVDAGADLVVGSHAHLPKAVEVHRGRPILYCLGNLIFPYAAPSWGNSLLAEVLLDDEGTLRALDLIPIRCRGEHAYSPVIMRDADGDHLLRTLGRASRRKFATPLRLRDHRLALRIAEDESAEAD